MSELEIHECNDFVVADWKDVAEPKSKKWIRTGVVTSKEGEDVRFEGVVFIKKELTKYDTFNNLKAEVSETNFYKSCEKIYELLEAYEEAESTMYEFEGVEGYERYYTQASIDCENIAEEVLEYFDVIQTFNLKETRTMDARVGYY